MKVLETKVIAVIGAPATGKTTLFRKIIDQTGGPLSWWRDGYKQVVYHTHDETKAVILGDYDAPDAFGGTDKLSMSVQKQAVAFLEKLVAGKKCPAVLFEGDRLGNNSFFDELDRIAGANFHVIELFAPEEILDRRHKDRKDKQTETWLAGRTTKLANIRRARHVERRANTSRENLRENAGYLLRLAGLLPAAAGE